MAKIKCLINKMLKLNFDRASAYRIEALMEFEKAIFK